MARNGVWELRELLLRYSPNSGSSRGVVDFVERDLVNFARANPQIKIATFVRKSGHPQVFASYSEYKYPICWQQITGYQRQLDLRNRTREEIIERFQYLRNSLGQKSPIHSQISCGVVKTKTISVQGIWHNTRDLRLPALPEEIEQRKELEAKIGFRKLKKEVGLQGLVDIVQRLLKKEERRREAALAAIPEPERVLPTE